MNAPVELLTMAEHRERYPVPPVSYPRGLRPLAPATVKIAGDGLKAPDRTMVARWGERLGKMASLVNPTAVDCGAVWGCSDDAARSCLVTMEGRGLVVRIEGGTRPNGQPVLRWRLAP